MNGIDRETMPADIVIVGGGPAGLSCALRLGQMKAEAGSPIAGAAIMLLEKSSYVGAHAISGAVMDPRGMRELVGDFLAQGCPVEAAVGKDDLHFLTESRGFRFPILPPMLRNHGNYVVSLHRIVKWLAEKVEASGIDLLPGFPGQELLFADGGEGGGERVVGVRAGDRGLDKDARPKSNFEPGVEIRAPIVILAEGARGSLTKSLVGRAGLDRGRNPQIYATGVKEVWEVPAGRIAPGEVFHTMGWPLSGEEYGGGWVYGMRENLVSLGFVIGLDYKNPWTDPHGLMQDWKRHPRVRSVIEGGKMLHYGAKAIPEGGYFSIPETAIDGCLVIGDAAGFLNAARLKGIHLAVKTGMLAAETAAEALASGDASRATLGRFAARVERSWVAEELRSVRNFRQGFERGLLAGVLHTGLAMATGGRGIRSRLPTRPDPAHMRTLAEQRRLGRSVEPPARSYDGVLTFDKLTDVYSSETTHEENQPCHLRVSDTDICRTRCREEYGNPCQHFCPAKVYEMVPDGTPDGIRLQINFTNCVHCKTCDIMDPYGIITWVPPEGGGGPNYVNL